MYSPHPSIQYSRNVLAAMEKKTGKNYEEWITIAKKSGLKTEEERRDWLKEEHGLGTNTAWWIAEMSFGKGRDAVDEDAYLKLAPGYVEEMYAGKAEPAADPRRPHRIGPVARAGRQGLPVPDDRAALPQSRLRPGQADDQDANRLRLRPGRHQGRPAG